MNTPRRAPRTKKTSINAKQNKKIKRLETEVKKLAKADELKWSDTSVVQTISTAGIVTPLLGLPVWGGGNLTRSFSREGNSIVLTDYRFKGLVEIPAPGTPNISDTTNRVRIIIFKTTGTGTTPGIIDILENSDINSFYKMKGKVKYSVMFDRTYNLTNLYQTSGTAVAAIGNSAEKWRIPFNVSLGKKLGKAGMKCQYSATSGGGANPVNNALYMLQLSDSGVVAHPFVTYRSRARFLDN